jgi:Ino eighty subunit 2
MDTINRLLKKQAPKRRGRAAANEAGDGTPGQEGNEPEKADPTLVRWVSGSNGCKVSVPEEWLGTPAGRMFGPPVSATGKMVEEL